MLRALFGLSAILSSAYLLGGCVSLGLHDTARTAPPGKVEFGGIVTPVFVWWDLPLSYGSAAVLFPLPELYARVGLSDNSDLGLRWAFGPGLRMDYKQRLASGGVDVAGQIGGSFLFLEGGSYFSLSPRLLMSRESEPGLPWAFNAGLDYYRLFYRDYYGEVSREGLLCLRAGFGLPFRVLESVRIMPETAVSLRVAGDADPYGSVVLAQRGLVVTLGVGLGSVEREEVE